MTISPVLKKALEREQFGVRRAFERLETDEREWVEAAFRRHAVACRRLAMPIDPMFIRSAIDDAIFEHSSYRNRTRMAQIGRIDIADIT